MGRRCLAYASQITLESLPGWSAALSQPPASAISLANPRVCLCQYAISASFGQPGHARPYVLGRSTSAGPLRSRPAQGPAVRCVSSLRSGWTAPDFGDRPSGSNRSSPARGTRAQTCPMVPTQPPRSIAFKAFAIARSSSTARCSLTRAARMLSCLPVIGFSPTGQIRGRALCRGPSQTGPPAPPGPPVAGSIRRPGSVPAPQAAAPTWARQNPLGKARGAARGLGIPRRCRCWTGVHRWPGVRESRFSNAQKTVGGR